MKKEDIEFLLACDEVKVCPKLVFSSSLETKCCMAKRLIVRKLIKKYGWTQKDATNYLGLSKSQISRLARYGSDKLMRDATYSCCIL